MRSDGSSCSALGHVASLDRGGLLGAGDRLQAPPTPSLPARLWFNRRLWGGLEPVVSLGHTVGPGARGPVPPRAACEELGSRVALLELA